jgi:hypothetical protein
MNHLTKSQDSKNETEKLKMRTSSIKTDKTL